MRRRRQTRTSSGHWNKLEDAVALQLDKSGLEYSYETIKLAFMQPERARSYTPDFVLVTQSGKVIFVETKGIFDSDDRQKHLWVREQHPDKDVRFVFSNSASKIYKGSKTSNAVWCQRNRFQYSDRLIPVAWLEE